MGINLETQSTQDQFESKIETNDRNANGTEPETRNELRDIIHKKEEEIDRMTGTHNEQKELIRTLSDSNDGSAEISQGLKMINILTNNLLTDFDGKYSRNTVYEIGNGDINDLFEQNSEFNTELNCYLAILKEINVCANKLDQSIANVKGYITDKFLPNMQEYEQWKLAEIMLWIKVLENGRCGKYLAVLENGFKESEILIGDVLPDLSAADLVSEPFNIKSFKDRIDLVKQFKKLRTQ